MVLAARRFEHARSMDRIDAPVDRTRWLMPPQARRLPARPPVCPLGITGAERRHAASYGHMVAHTRVVSVVGASIVSRMTPLRCRW